MIKPNPHLHAKEEKKLSNSFWEIKILIGKLTTTMDEGRRRAMDNSLEKFCCLIFGYSGGPGWPINNSGPILLFSYPLTYINLHIKYGNNPIRIS